MLYTVQSSDTLTRIAASLGSGICDIAKASGLANPDFILNGAVLTVPVKVASPDNKSCLKQAAPATAVCVTTGAGSYTIEAGDTLYLVSVALGITLDSLLAANKGVVPENLNVGDKVRGNMTPYHPNPGPQTHFFITLLSMSICNVLTSMGGNRSTFPLVKWRHWTLQQLLVGG